MTQTDLAWQSKLILLVVVPAVASDVFVKTVWWSGQQPTVVIWTIGLSLLLGLITWKLRAATPGAAATGTLITASLIYSTLGFPYKPWHTALIPVLAVSLLAFGATRAGRAKKERLGTAEHRSGRKAAQVAANLGAAALVASEFLRSMVYQTHWLARIRPEQAPMMVAALASLAEAAADTVSSELGQVFGGRPRLLTTMGEVDPGTDGAISLAGSLAGILAAATVALVGTAALGGNTKMFAISTSGAVFGLFVDSLIGATLEQAGWMNNDLVNTFSTAGAAVFALAVLAFTH